MKKSFTASVLVSTLLLTGCTTLTKETIGSAMKEEANANYQLSDSLVVQHIKYQSTKQYRSEKKAQFTREINDYVEKEGYAEFGYNKEGFNRRGYNLNGFNQDGYDEYGYNINGIKASGTDVNRRPSTFKSPYDTFGFKKNGMNEDGYDRFGFDSDGYNQDGFNKLGESKIKGELSIEDFNRRKWNDISMKELLTFDLLTTEYEKRIRDHKNLEKLYYSESMHPFSKESLEISFLHNSLPVMLDELTNDIKMESIGKLKIEHLNNRDELIVFETEDGEKLNLINDEKLLPQNFESRWQEISELKEGSVILLEDADGFTEEFTLKKRQKLTEIQQSYLDVARVAIQGSKGKWGEAVIQLDFLLLKGLDQMNDDTQLTESMLAKIYVENKEHWPKNYLTDTNVKIEKYDAQQREQFIHEIIETISFK